MNDEAVWKRRFHLFAALRILGLLTFFAGLAVAFSDLARVGGWPLVGLPIAFIGLADAVIAPKILKRGWDKPER